VNRTLSEATGDLSGVVQAIHHIRYISELKAVAIVYFYRTGLSCWLAYHILYSNTSHPAYILAPEIIIFPI
jgi:hypothetical protein